MEASGVWSAVGEGYADENIVWAGFGVFGDDIEVAGFGKDPGVFEFEFAIHFAASGIFFEELGVGESGLGVFVKGSEIGVGGGGIEIVPDFFGVFAVVAFGVGQSKNSFFENGVAFVPEGEGEAESGVSVGDPEEAIFAPAIGAASGIVVGEIVPGIAIG